MKLLNIISATALSLLVFASCETQLDRPKLSAEGDFKAPVLKEHAAVIADQDNIKTEEVTFSWSDADFGQKVQIEYSLWLGYKDQEALLGTTSSTIYSISKTDFMGKLCNDLKAEKNVKLDEDVKTWVTAIPAESQFNGVKSNVIAYSVTTYVPTKRQIYLPGKYNGWGATNCPFWETDGGSNTYKTMVDVSNTEETPYYFKLVLSDGTSWTGFDKIAPASWEVADPDNSDKNYSVPAGSGKVRLTVNLSTNKIYKEDISAVEIIGDFDSWAGTEMTFDPNENVWKADATYASAGGLLIRLNKDWNMKFGNGTVASEEVEGGVVLDEDTQSANIPVEAGTYTMILHANRTPFVLVMSKK